MFCGIWRDLRGNFAVPAVAAVVIKVVVAVTIIGDGDNDVVGWADLLVRYLQVDSDLWRSGPPSY